MYNSLSYPLGYLKSTDKKRINNQIFKLLIFHNLCLLSSTIYNLLMTLGINLMTFLTGSRINFYPENLGFR